MTNGGQGPDHRDSPAEKRPSKEDVDGGDCHCVVVVASDRDPRGKQIDHKHRDPKGNDPKERHHVADCRAWIMGCAPSDYSTKRKQPEHGGDHQREAKKETKESRVTLRGARVTRLHSIGSLWRCHPVRLDRWPSRQRRWDGFRPLAHAIDDGTWQRIRPPTRRAREPAGTGCQNLVNGHLRQRIDALASWAGNSHVAPSTALCRGRSGCHHPPVTIGEQAEVFPKSLKK